MTEDSSAIPRREEIDPILASTSRPSVLTNETELIALRQAIDAGGPQHDAYVQPLRPGDNEYGGKAIRAIADKYLGMDIRIPERGGHAHKFFCDCGSMLKLPPDMEPCAEYTCPSCGKTHSGEKYDDAVRLLKHLALANGALHLALVHAIEGKPAYANKVAEILRKYAKAYPGPHTTNTVGGILQMSLNEAEWAIQLSRAYDLIYNSGSLCDADMRLIEDRLFKPVAQGLMQTEVGGNWLSWHLSAVGIVGLAIRDASLVDYALKEFQSQMTHDLGDDGLWPESVHCYHFFALDAFVDFAEAAERSGIDLYDYEPKPGKGLKAMFVAPIQYMYPSFRLPAVNDGWYESWLPLDLYETAYRRWSDPAFAWALNNGHDKEKAARYENSLGDLGKPTLYGFLFGSKLPDNPPAPAFRGTDFSSLGLCTMRNDNTMLTFHYGRFLGHGHLDKLSFTLYRNGEENSGPGKEPSRGMAIAPDYGTPGYGCRILKWYTGTRSHNTVVVDGIDQARSAESTIDVFHAGDIVQYAQASASDVYPGVTQTRRILLIGNVCLIVDDIESDEEHDYDWLLHCEGRAEVIGSYSPESVDCSMYPEVTLDRTDRFADTYRLHSSTETGDLAFGIWTGTGGGLIGLGKCPAETDVRHASFLMCREHGRDARFVASLGVSTPDDAARITRDGDTIRVETKDEADFIAVKNLMGTVEPGEVTTDAEIAAVRIKDGRLVGAALVHGSWLKWKGETLIERPSKVDCAEAAL